MRLSTLAGVAVLMVSAVALAQTVQRRVERKDAPAASTRVTNQTVVDTPPAASNTMPADSKIELATPPR